MKNIKYLIIILGSLLLAWLLPKSYHLVTDIASPNIFTYYSSIDKAFCAIEFDEKEGHLIRKNIKTNRVYSELEFDSILPMFYSTQLFADGRMPKSIDGIDINPRIVNSKKFFFRVKPADKNKPHIPLYTLFESMSGRVRIEMPGDVFRLRDKIEFINPETNEINTEKSEKFNHHFVKRGFQFPAKMAAGNPSTRKAYDEGYFIIDNMNQIFHLKMVNSMPFLKKVPLPSEIVPEYILTMEPDDRSFYAFVFDANKKLHLITTDSYKLQEIPTPNYDVDRDQMMIMANPLYWNVNVVSSRGKEVMALHADTKEIADRTLIEGQAVGTNYSKYFLPFAVGFTSGNTKYIKPIIHFGSYLVLVTNFLLALIFVFIIRYRKQEFQFIPVVWIACTGIYGFITSLIFNR
ncbi:DUF4857 domain-containing protein [Marinifilum caeruleilacunae]|uniref:DUF4857 domain-containing protein n=1 Tax=Marinifilum caeruleilacunae TaxID=2499076 RepID=A0ABX1WQL8_9BACT|nr:DUF4857 domain-containing protein [Marinifilum caeruleilacunae]NOU58378.1 DUF4857 domain-containing protein [Marinifilum caeruleilacunae]